MTKASADGRVRANDYMPVVANNLTAAGSSQVTALAIPVGQDCSICTTVAASTGVVLPVTGVSLGEVYSVANHGANALSIYPAVNGFIGAAAQNAAYSLASGNSVSLMYVGSGHWCVGV